MLDEDVRTKMGRDLKKETGGVRKKGISKEIKTHARGTPEPSTKTQSTTEMRSQDSAIRQSTQQSLGFDGYPIPVCPRVATHPHNLPLFFRPRRCDITSKAYVSHR